LVGGHLRAWIDAVSIVLRGWNIIGKIDGESLRNREDADWDSSFSMAENLDIGTSCEIGSNITVVTFQQGANHSSIFLLSRIHGFMLGICFWFIRCWASSFWLV
jgi:hypothetical protein